MLFEDSTPVQVVAKANGHAIITTNPSKKKRAQVYKLSKKHGYPDDIGEWVRVAKRFGMAQTSYTSNLCFGMTQTSYSSDLCFDSLFAHC